MNACPTEEAIDAFIEARADAAFRVQLEEHLDRCTACGVVVTRLLSVIDSAATREPAERTIGDGSLRGERARAAFAEGDTFGRYIILKTVGAGGMGRVYAAYDTSLDRRVALKFLAHGSSDAAVARLLKEAAAMAKLNHPNVVTVFDAGTVMDEPYIAMELVDGETMADWRRSAVRTTREICRVMAATARGVAAAHAAGIVHRDIKPQNVLIAGDRVLVTDFGLSVTNRSDERDLVGTPGFMAPEQFVGAPVDVRTDVFGFCATLYFMLHGVVPFQADRLTDLKRLVIAGQVTPPPARSQIPARLHQLALQGLVPEPSARPTDLTAIADALLFDPAVRRRRVATGAGVAAIVAGAFAGGLYLTSDPQRRCSAGGEAIAFDFTREDRARIRQHFVAAKLLDSWPALEQRIDRYVSAWRATHAETCAASFGKARQSLALFDLRLMCLEGQRAWLASLVDALPTSSAKQLAIAGGVGLPDVSECSDVGRANQKPLPGVPEARATATDLQQRIDTATSDVVLGKYEKATAAIETALADARKFGYEPLIAQALFQRAELEEHGRAKSATQAGPTAAVQPTVRAMYEEAYSLAERSGADWIRVMVSVGLIQHNINKSRLDDADLWVRLTSALLLRLGDPIKRRANLEHSIGNLALARGRREEAKPALDRAIALTRQLSGENAPQLVTTMLARCDTETDRTVSQACYEKLLQFALATEGPNHPHLAGIYNNMALMWTTSRSTRPKACGLIEKALKIFEIAISANNRERLILEGNLADCLRLTGRLAESRARFTQLLGRLETQSANRMWIRRDFGVLLWGEGEYDEAERFMRMALADGTALFKETDEGMYGIRCSLAEFLLATHRPADALAEADRTFAAFSAAKIPVPHVAAFVVKGRALLALRRPDQALEAFAGATAFFEKNQVPANERGLSLLGQGQAEHALGHHARALAHLERALSVSPSEEVDPEIRGLVTEGLARALADVRPPPDRAARLARTERVCSLATEAATAFEKAPRSYADDLKRARTFLTQRRCRRA